MLTHKLQKSPDLRGYHRSIQELVSSGVVKEVSPQEAKKSSVFYFLHRPVVKETSVSTKIRPVFDASAKGSNGVSLNDCLYTGPSMIPNLVSVLIRFRCWRVALTADVTKVFLKVGVQEDDQDVQRFLWDDQGTVRVMKFLRVPFGNKVSTFLLNATIQHHLNSTPSSHLVEELKENFYVDDLLLGAGSEEEACVFLCKACALMKSTSMSLDKVGFNSVQVMDMVLHEFDSKYSGSEVNKVLGLKWLATSDQFSFEVLEIPKFLVVTKRVILSFIARLFDPLGFLAPFVMVAKILFHDLWKAGVDWDLPEPEVSEKVFTQWLDGFRYLGSLFIPRSYSGLPWHASFRHELHAFGIRLMEGLWGLCVLERGV